MGWLSVNNNYKYRAEGAIREAEELVEIQQERDFGQNLLANIRQYRIAKEQLEAYGDTDDVTSSTFNIIKEYKGELPLYHMDVYRVSDNIENLGIEEYFDKGGVTIIEWADLIKDYLPEERLDIKFRVVDEKPIISGLYSIIFSINCSLLNLYNN